VAHCQDVCNTPLQDRGSVEKMGVAGRIAAASVPHAQLKAQGSQLKARDAMRMLVAGATDGGRPSIVARIGFYWSSA
jgi:hypothetical protein